MQDISRIMCADVCRDLETEPYDIQTPVAAATGHQLVRPVVLVPILRAGLGLLDGFSQILSEAAVGHIGMYRDEETLEPKSYYSNMPDHLSESDVILLDPMLATGSSSIEAAHQLKSQGATRICFACLIAAPEGIAAFEAAHPEMAIFTAAIDEKLNDKAYIVPGLGDAGDRYFGTD